MLQRKKIRNVRGWGTQGRNAIFIRVIWERLQEGDIWTKSWKRKKASHASIWGKHLPNLFLWWFRGHIWIFPAGYWRYNSERESTLFGAIGGKDAVFYLFGFQIVRSYVNGHAGSVCNKKYWFDYFDALIFLSATSFLAHIYKDSIKKPPGGIS